jgi:hypothetical protein
MTNSRNKGNRIEREIAQAFGVTRHHRSDFSESAPDIITDREIIEVKARKTTALEGWLAQCEQHAEDGKVCIVVSKQDRCEPIASMRLSDYINGSQVDPVNGSGGNDE